MISRALAGVLGLAVLFAVTIALELPGIVADDGAMIATVPSPTPARPNPAIPLRVTRVDRDELVDGILARPLFAATRRPAAVAARTATAPANLPRVAGILVNGRSRSVIFAAREGGRPVVVHEGAQVGAYTVESIEAGQVTLLGPGGAQVLHPSFDARPRDPGAAAGPGAALATDVMQSLRNLPGFPGAAR
jgi:hypothetical protein